MRLLFILSLIKLCLSQFTVTFTSAETGKPIVTYSQDYLYSMYKKDDKIKHIFNAIDIDYNNFLSYIELEFYQRITDPQLLLTRKDYYQFSNTYYELSDLLGTNITKDFNIIIKLQATKAY